MIDLLQSEGRSRPPRLKFAHTPPAILRFPSGDRVQGKLQVVSITGGLLSLPTPVDQGSRAKLMFVTETGPVAGTAEMLIPISRTQQPFRFVAIGDDDRDRIRDAIRFSADQKRREQQLIVRDRAW